ncbi:hypothetical protein BOW53_01225 [Solemya pervernicosa gill symbiont]|uniref:HDOD domain-containing protein n=1 Tax=Solemya pervernicosa gill symbiont TaxID=642797 RepID=A0A1T2LAY3_9GAMM|nr:HDOD domain-containing protein [Solemya pervernicosa gill symbiont]OOZ42230.1 hypothetical protein BOW53_01225 [Solemya pervernicosa gill symbiont]
MAIELKKVEREILEFPPLPEAVREVTALFGHDHVSFAALEKKICQDPALTARVLAVANSAFYGFGGKISSLKQACMILGLHTTRNIVTSLGVISNLKSGRGSGLDISGLWHHSAGVAGAAKVLSKYAGVEEGEAFTSGLLHDVGKMVFDIYYSREYREVLSCCSETNILLREAELKVLSFDRFSNRCKACRALENARKPR